MKKFIVKSLFVIGAAAFILVSVPQQAHASILGIGFPVGLSVDTDSVSNVSPYTEQYSERPLFCVSSEASSLPVKFHLNANCDESTIVPSSYTNAQRLDVLEDMIQDACDNNLIDICLPQYYTIDTQ